MFYHLSTFLSSHNHSCCICLLIIFSKLLARSLSLSLPPSLPPSNISICDAFWKKLYLRFLQQCCRGFTTFYKAVFSLFQHTNTLKVVHFEGMNWACTHLPSSSTNETKLLPLYLLLCHHKVFHLLHVITVFCFTTSLFLLCVYLCRGEEQHYDPAACTAWSTLPFLKKVSKFVVLLLSFPASILVPVFF